LVGVPVEIPGAQGASPGFLFLRAWGFDSGGWGVIVLRKTLTPTLSRRERGKKLLYR